MQSMLDMCVSFGLSNDTTFNPKKSGFYITNLTGNWVKMISVSLRNCHI